jgi:hypothetical protein
VLSFLEASKLNKQINKMEYKNKLNQIKALLSLEVKLAQMTLADGITVVEAEEFEPEYSVGIVTPDGIVPMPVGEYELQDGSMVVVEVEGIIASVGPKAEEEEMPEVEAAPEAVVEPEMGAAPSAPQPKRIVESVSKESFFEAQVAELKAEIEALKLAAQTKEEEVQLASQEEAAEAISFNPESAIKPEGYKYGKNRTKNIQDSVYNKLFN